MSTTPQSVSIVTFQDALGLAMVLADTYAFANGIAILNRSGELVDLAIVEGIGQTIEPLVRWIGSEYRNRPPEAESSAILLSVRPYEADLVREEDLRLYRHASWAITAAGLHLQDWIETDGDLFRSYAYMTCPARAWEDDPPDEPQRW